MAWIESHQALGHHPKTIQLAESLKCSLPAAVGHLHYLWWWALEYAPNGVVKGSPSVVAQACMWHGKAERFWQGLLESGFIDMTDEGAVVHDWYDYAGRLVDKRAANRRRMRAARATNGATNGAAHEESTFDARAGATVPNRTVPNRTGSPARLAGRFAGPPARGDADLQPLATLLADDLPDEVRQRLGQPPLGQPALPASPSNASPETNGDARN